MYALSIREVCERALRKVGAFAFDEVGADPAKFDEARLWLDMLIGHMAASKRCFWLIDRPYHLELKKGVQTYTLLDELYPKPPTGIMFPVDARLQMHEPPEEVPAVTSYTDLSAPITPSVPFPLLRRVNEWDAIPDKTKEAEPNKGYFSRTDNPTLDVHYVPNQDMRWSVDLVVQEYTADFVSPNPTTKIEKVRESWNRYLVLALAYDIGTGPVTVMEEQEARRLKRDRDDAHTDLFSFEDQEHADEPRRVRYSGSI